MYLKNKYEVALAEIMYPHTWPTFNLKQDYDLKYANRIGQIFTVSIPPGYYTEMDELIKELNKVIEMSTERCRRYIICVPSHHRKSEIVLEKCLFSQVLSRFSRCVRIQNQ